MTETAVLKVADRNLTATYYSLAATIDGATQFFEEAFRGVTAPHNHPICNFATDLKLDPWAVNRLRDLASSRPTFNVYSMSSDSPEHRADLLMAGGFRESYRLCQMVCEKREPESPCQLHRAITPEDRAVVADFMARQFFGRHPADFQTLVKQATANASPLELYSLGMDDQLAGAVMVSPLEGVCGLYNLCVDMRHRGCGWGAAIVSFVQNLALERGLPVTLQCDLKLESWYGNLGFRTIGYVEVYGLPKGRIVDIMQ